MKRFIREFGKGFTLGVLIFLIIGVVQYLGGSTPIDKKELLVLFAYNQLYSVVLYMANAYLFMYLSGTYKKKFFTLRMFLTSIGSGTLVTLGCLVLLRVFSEIIVEGETVEEFIAQEKAQFYYGSLLISIVVTTIFYVYYYVRHQQEHKVKEQKIIAGTASAKFDALKNQLDPHFLFNSLNVLTSLIEENTDSATKFTTSLSKVYRYVLEQKDKELVTVAEELKFAELYMSLLKMRFEDSIVFTTPETLSNPEAKVVPLSLQLILENAVKHNQVTPTRKLFIDVYEENGNLVVKNNVQPKQVVRESSGVGLKNIRQRYYLLTDRPVEVKQDRREFSIAIPMLTKKNTTMNKQDTYISEKKYARAKERVEKIKEFYIHFAIYLIMVPVFIWLNVRSTPFPWAIFPIAGWGFGVLGHASEAFDYNPFLGRKWEERKLREFMEKDDFDKFK